MTAIGSDQQSQPEPAGQPQRADRPNPAPARTYGVTTGRGVALVAKREILTEIRQKSFRWSLGIMAALIVLVILGSSLLGSAGEAIFGDASEQTVAVSAAARDELPAPLGEMATADDLNIAEADAASAEQGLEQLRDGSADALILTRAEAAGLEVYDAASEPLDLASEPLDLAGEPETGRSELVVIGADGVPGDLAEALAVKPQVAQLAPGGSDDGLRYGLTILFAITFMSGTMGYCQRIAQTVVEEKASRIVEILLATITPKTIMAGKVLGNSILALGQMGVLGVAAGVAMALTGQLEMLVALVPALLVFLAFFIVGFVMFAALYAGVAALVSRQEEVAGATMPLLLLIMLPYMAAIFLNGNPAAMTAMSYIPISAPIVMPVRIMLGEALWWEPLVALALLLVTTLAAIWFGARVYENSVLRTGGRVKLAEALKSS